jgi:hypothetical protein
LFAALKSSVLGQGVSSDMEPVLLKVANCELDGIGLPVVTWIELVPQICWECPDLRPDWAELEVLLTGSSTI